jgi:hypothetical protein
VSIDPLTIATWALVLVTLAGVIFIPIGLFRDTQARREQNDTLRKRETMRLYMEAHVRHEQTRTLQPRAALVQSAMGDTDEARESRRIIRSYLNHWEVIATGALDGVLDEALLRRMARRIVLSIASDFESYIQWRRGELGSATLWIELETLAARWRATEQTPQR